MTPQAAERELLAVLAEEGCPVCRSLIGSDTRYFAEFVAEGHLDGDVHAALERSLGFCPAHGIGFVRGRHEGRSELAFVHELLARRLRTVLLDRGRRRSWEAAVLAGGGAPGPCPACRARARRAEGTVFFLALLLRNPTTAGRYAPPGLLCLPHLQALAPRLDAPTLMRLLGMHEDVLAAVAQRPPPNDGLERTQALRLTIGHERELDPWPPPTAGAPLPERPDPIRQLADSLGQADACPICLEVGRARLEWLRWLDAAAQRGETLQDVLPTCPDHVWATVRAGGPALATATVGRLLELALTRVRLAREGQTRPAAVSVGPLARHQPLRAARELLARADACPVCHRLAAAQDRSLLLLLALLEQPRHRAAFHDGYGLCLKHFARAVALAPTPMVGALLAEVQLARLGLLHWELTEYRRKAAWPARPEPKGTEQQAPVRAVRRFSGCLGRAEGEPV